MSVFKSIIMGLFAGLAFALVFPYSTNAQSPELQQQIKPIECVYTTTITGNNSTVDSTCDNQPVPTVTEVIVNDGSPIIIGTYQSATARSLRVWLDAQWYTNGVDPRLKTESDLWTLNLSGTLMLLAEGDYIVIVEVETISGLLLRNTFAATFSVLPRAGTANSPVLQEIRSINNGGAPSVPSFFIIPSPPQSYQIIPLQKPATKPIERLDNFFSPLETNDWLLRRIIAGIIGIGLVSLALHYALVLYRR